MKFIVFLSVFLISGTLTCRSRKTCDCGWTLINRTLGGSCVRIISPPSITSLATAAEACNKIGAVLSSIENYKELDVEADLMKKKSVNNTIVGAKLKDDCVCSDFTDYDDVCGNQTTTCVFKTAFDWTDNFTVGRNVWDTLRGVSDSIDFYQTLRQYGSSDTIEIIIKHVELFQFRFFAENFQVLKFSA